jgi:gas vesicle protein
MGLFMSIRVSFLYVTIHGSRRDSLLLDIENQNGEDKMRNAEYGTNRSGLSLTAFLIGGLIGGTIALLYAPQSGKKTREFLITEGGETADRVIHSILDAQENVLAMIEDAQNRMQFMSKETKDRLQRLQEIARSTISEQKDSLTRGYTEAKDVMKSRAPEG